MERRLGIKDRFSELASYRNPIARLWGFHAVAKTGWAEFLEPVTSDFPTRRKAPLRFCDLQVVGVRIMATVVPTVADAAAALGAFDVFEEATLGGQHLLTLTERGPGLSTRHGASYFAGLRSPYGRDVEAVRCRRRAHCQDSDTSGHVVATARTTFRAMEQWLC